MHGIPEKAMILNVCSGHVASPWPMSIVYLFLPLPLYCDDSLFHVENMYIYKLGMIIRISSESRVNLVTVHNKSTPIIPIDISTL